MSRAEEPSSDQARTAYDRLRPLLFRFDPETAHALMLQLLRLLGATSAGRTLLQRVFKPPPSRSPVSVFGLEFPNRLGLAAGYDKNGIASAGLACLGFGHLELGTVTPAPQLGQPAPRMFRLPDDEALINRLGFPNKGAAALRTRLQSATRTGALMGVNIGKGTQTPIEEAAGDYRLLIHTFAPFADYLAINVSSPNTVGLRRLQSREFLADLLHAIGLERDVAAKQSGRRVPVLIKIAPDLTDAELEQMIGTIMSEGMDGVIATNTTVQRSGLISAARSEGGGLSGKPLRQRAREVVGKIAKISSGRLPIIGVGGISSAADAKAMLDHGASLVQIYSGLVYRGPGLVSRILADLPG